MPLLSRLQELQGTGDGGWGMGRKEMNSSSPRSDLQRRKRPSSTDSVKEVGTTPGQPPPEQEC